MQNQLRDRKSRVQAGCVARALLGRQCLLKGRCLFTLAGARFSWRLKEENVFCLYESPETLLYPKRDFSQTQ